MDTPALNFPVINITGSHSGYVIEPTDLYLRGNNIAGFSFSTTIHDRNDKCIFNSGMMSITVRRTSPSSNEGSLTTYAAYNLAGFTRIYMECYTANISAPFTLLAADRSVQVIAQFAGYSTITFPFSGWDLTSTLIIKLPPCNLDVYRIWLA